MNGRFLLIAVLIFFASTLAIHVVLADEPTAEGVEFFEKKIRPILVDHCYECHSATSKELSGGLRLDSPQGLLKGGDSGPALIVGDAEKSLLILAVRQADKDLRMPPKQKLSDTQIEDLATWVKMGAPDPRKPPADVATSGKPKYGMSLEEGRQFWSFQAVQNPPVPAVKAAAWPKTTIDNFILAKQEAVGISPAAAADKRTLLRRVTFDLTGLPPTPEEHAAFMADASPEAFEKVVDRLLNSRRYGERWGRHWLDVVRYADTCGNGSDFPVPQASQYRDWVIKAFNANLPYDQFLREQIAGDLIPGGSDAERYDRIMATGYLAISRRFGGDRMGEFHLTLEDTIDNLGRAVLGSSIACARCHDHKFDPFTQNDYYGLYGIFSSTRYPFPGAEVGKQQEDFVPLMKPEEIEALLKPHREALAALDAEIKTLEAAEAEAKKLGDSAEAKAKIEAATKTLNETRGKRNALAVQSPAIKNAYAVAEGAPANSKIHLRGDPKRLGDEVPRHFPAILGAQVVPAGVPSSGRLELAQWLTDVKNPLTARVMVNRIWQYHFGKGIVQTPNDFGKQGKAPTHPELLDFLAGRFIESGWSIKSMHKLILLSQTYQQSSEASPQTLQLDASNDLFSRYQRRRLDAESIRDSLLFVSSDLDENPPAGHPFPAQHTWGFTQHTPFFAMYETRARSVYLMQQRLRKHRYLALFDGADPNSSTSVRLPSTTPLQALFIMNDPLAHALAAKFAARIAVPSAEESKRIESAYQIALSRSPTAEEQQECIAFLQQYRDKLASIATPADQVDSLAWSAFARTLLSSNEFVFVD